MKILEQILQEIEKESYSTNTDYGYSVVVNMDSVARIIRSHIEDDGWIPVDEGNFPPNLEDKLLQTDSGSMYVGWYNRELLEFETEEFMFGGAYGKVIAWRPLPEPYHPKED